MRFDCKRERQKKDHVHSHLPSPSSALTLSRTCHPAEPAAHSSHLTKCMHSTLKVLTTLGAFHSLFTRSPNYSSLLYYLHSYDMKSKSYFCALKFTVVNSSGYIKLVFCFFWTISALHSASVI